MNNRKEHAMGKRRRAAWIAVLSSLVLALAAVAAGCGGGDDGGAPEGSEEVSGSISLMMPVKRP